MLSTTRAPWALHWRGKLSSGWEQWRVGALLPSLKLCDGWPFKAIPDGPGGKRPMQVFGSTIKKALYKPTWLFPHNMLLHALLNTVEDTGWLDPKGVNAIYDLAEEITSVFHVLLALAWKEPEIEKTHWTGQWEHWKLQQSKRKMASTNSSRELEVREDKKLHVHLWCAVAQRKIPVHFYGVHTPIVLSRTDTKYYEQKEPDYSIFLGIAALWTNREKLKEAKLLMGLPDT